MLNVHMINVIGCKTHKNAWAWLACVTPNTLTHTHWLTVFPAIWLFYYNVANLNSQRRPSAAVENSVTLWTTPIHPPAEALKTWGKICPSDAPRMGDEDALLSGVQWRHFHYTIKFFVSSFSTWVSNKFIMCGVIMWAHVCVCVCVPDGLWISRAVLDCVAPSPNDRVLWVWPVFSDVRGHPKAPWSCRVEKAATRRHTIVRWTAFPLLWSCSGHFASCFCRSSTESWPAHQRPPSEMQSLLGCVDCQRGASVSKPPTADEREHWWVAGGSCVFRGCCVGKETILDG